MPDSDLYALRSRLVLLTQRLDDHVRLRASKGLPPPTEVEAARPLVDRAASTLDRDGHPGTWDLIKQDVTHDLDLIGVELARLDKKFMEPKIGGTN